MTVTISEGSQGAISGSGNLSGSGGSAAVTISSGTRAGNSIAFTMQSSGFHDLNYSGTIVNESQINGTLNGSGFNNQTMNLAKQ